MIHFSQTQLQLNKWGPYLTFEKFLTPEECSKLIAQMPNTKLEEARVDTVGVKNDSIRSTKVCALDFIPENEWLFHRLEESIVRANGDVYGFDLKGFHEVIQLMEYGPGDHYDWHMDSGNSQFSIRKLSVSIQLSHESDYEGGHLEFFNNGLAPRDQGTMILFPSYMYHRVQKITSGTRRALISWISGDPYR